MENCACGPESELWHRDSIQTTAISFDPFRLHSGFSYYTALSVAAFPMTGCFYSIRREICYGFLCYADLLLRQ